MAARRGLLRLYNGSLIATEEAEGQGFK